MKCKKFNSLWKVMDLAYKKNHTQEIKELRKQIKQVPAFSYTKFKLYDIKVSAGRIN
jgi:hypothetical protein